MQKKMKPKWVQVGSEREPIHEVWLPRPRKILGRTQHRSHSNPPWRDAGPKQAPRKPQASVPGFIIFQGASFGG